MLDLVRCMLLLRCLYFALLCSLYRCHRTANTRICMLYVTVTCRYLHAVGQVCVSVCVSRL
jgi:hypothetical protein